jgi:hypothetical protein
MKAAILGGVVLAFVGGACIVRAVEPVPVEPPAVEPTTAKCTYRDEPVPTSAPIAESALALLARQPAESGQVRSDTVIELDLEYRIKDFGARSVNIMPFFKTLGDGSSSPGELSDYPALKSAAGKVHMCIPLAEMYTVPTLEWPIRFGLNLMQSLSGGSMQFLASTPNLKFDSADPPEGAIARQADQPPIEYFDNLRAAWNFFESRLARYKACVERFPEGQAALTRSYRRWESRHADTIQFVSELQFDFYLLSSRNDTGYATRMFDAAHEGTLHAYAQQPIESLRQHCARALSEFSDSEDPTDSAIEDEIAYLKKWRAAHPKAKP